MSEVFSPQERLQSVETLVTERPEIVGLQSYEYFRNDGQSQKEDLLKGKITSLSLTYPELEDGSIVELAEQTRGVLISLGNGERSDKTESLYNSIEYRYSEMFLISLAAQMNDPNLSEEERTEVVDWYQATNESLYGKPKKEVFSALARSNILPHIVGDFSGDEEAHRIQTELKGLIGGIDRKGSDVYKPSAETLQRIHDLVHERFDELVSHIDPEKVYTVQEIVEVFDIALEKMGAKELGWIAPIIKNSSALSTSAHQKQLEVGENRKNIKGLELMGKTVHEGGIHALKSIIALRAGWLSAAYGQEGYLPFEEGLATALEDAYKGKFEDHGVEYYLAAGLAYGLDNHEERDFPEVYEIMWRKNALNAANEQEITEEAIEKAKSKAFTSCMRIFRGTTTTDKGVIYSKDLAYFTGQELAWTVLDEVQTQDDFDLLLAGKLDLTRESHLAIAKQIVDANKTPA